MNHPIIPFPEGVQRPLLAFGSSGLICHVADNETQVLKSPLRHDLSRCDDATFLHMKDEEAFSAACIEREKLIYQSLPKNSHILDCLEITNLGIKLPYMPHGHLRQYLQTHSPNTIINHLKHTWIHSAVSAISFIHSYGIIHGDISARNFLISADLSLKLCDFAGSGIKDLPALVEEEDRYRKAPGELRTVQTDLFALGCLIFEILVGRRPYEEVADEEWEVIAENYERGVFPSVDGLGDGYGRVVWKCWMGEYVEAGEVLRDVERVEEDGGRSSWFEAGIFLGMVSVCVFGVWIYRLNRSS